MGLDCWEGGGVVSVLGWTVGGGVVFWVGLFFLGGGV